MGSENSGSNIMFFLAGMGIGAMVALLFAPRSGEETRKYVVGKAGEGRDYVTTRSKDLRKQAGDAVDKGKDLVTTQKERLSAALEAGKQAYQEEKAKGQ